MNEEPTIKMYVWAGYRKDLSVVLAAAHAYSAEEAVQNLKMNGCSEGWDGIRLTNMEPQIREGVSCVWMTSKNNQISESENKLKLYIWNEVLWDYTSGMVFAFAASVEEAIEMLQKQSIGKEHWSGTKLDGVEPVVYDTPTCYSIYGGG